MMDTRSNRSLAHVLADIAAIFSSGDEPEERLKHALKAVREVVPYSECALLTLRPQEIYLCNPSASHPPEALLVTVRALLDELVQGGTLGATDWPRWNAHLAVPLVDPDVQVLGLLLLARDLGAFDDFDLHVLSILSGQITAYLSWLDFREERGRLLAREHACREAADDANRAKDAFLATLSHELRSPLNAIVGWSDMLLRGTLPPETVQRGLQAIHRNAQAQTHIIEDVLDVSRIVTGKFRIEKGQADLTAVLQSALDAIRPVAESKGVALRAALPQAPTPAAGDTNRLHQAFSNLLSNAVKFTPSGGEVRLSLTESPEGSQVAVRDNGIGIHPEVLPRVFDRFFQHDSSTTRRHTGLGLGLAIVKHIVEEHGGRVQVSSAGEGQGATFTVTLPTQGATVEREPGEGATPRWTRDLESLRLEGLAVLIVDDEEETRVFLSTLLAGRGAVVKTASGAEEALQLARQSAFDLIVADLAMPGKDGLTLIRQLRERGVRAPAIVLTAHGRPEDRDAALKAGFDAYLAKPVLLADLLQMIGRLLTKTERGISVSGNGLYAQ